MQTRKNTNTFLLYFDEYDTTPVSSNYDFAKINFFLAFTSYPFRLG